MKRSLYQAIALAAVVIAAFQFGRLTEPSARSQDAKSTASPEVRYAQAELKLAEANLRKAQRINERVAKAVSGSVMAEYQSDIEIAKFRLDRASNDEASGFQVALKSAEAMAKSAKTIWQGAMSANKQVPGAVDDLDVERTRLRAEVFQSNFERGQALVGKSREAQLDWQLSILSDEVARLNEVIFRLTSPSTVNPR